MEINSHIFRGYDIRGEVDKDLNPEIVELIGKAHGTYLKSINVDKCVVGSDNRLSSDSYRAAVIKGLVSTGMHVIDMGLALSPIVYWGQHFYKSKGAVMITGSHNPVEYNGFKLGRDYDDTLTPVGEIKKMVIEENFVTGEGSSEVADPGYIEEYYKDLLSKVDEIRKFKVVVDASNTAAGIYNPEILRRAGCEVIEQNCELDGTFPSGTPDPTEERIAQRLAERVVKEKADVGFSFDSDGDRIGFVDEKGTIIWNDVLVAVFAADALDTNPGAPIVYNSLCSKIVTDVIKKAGGKDVMWLTGHAFIKGKVREEKAPYGGELSGHMYFMDRFYPHDAGGYAALRLLAFLTRKNMTFSELLDTFPKYISSPEIKIGCSDEKKFDVIHQISKVVKKDYVGEQISEYDDPKKDVYVRVDFSDGMLIIRPSQNGPYLTVKFEAQDKKTYEERRQYIKKLLHSYSDIDWSKEAANLEELNK